MERTMKTRLLMAVAVTGILWMAPGSAGAADQAGDQARVKEQKQEQIYGSQLMTEQERNEFRAKMRAAKTDAEREQIRKAHHEQM
jgi:hypothetical protein